MQGVTNNKPVIFATILVLLAMLSYNFFLSSDVVLTEGAPVVGSDIIALADELTNATLNKSLFSKPGYVLLTDYTVAISPEPLGRNNPFEVIGRE